MPNLFTQLFTFRAKENFSAKENFLTEAFAYFLQRDRGVFKAFVEMITGSRLDVEPGYQVLTRAVEASPNGHCFPDLKLVFRAADGDDWTVLSEHKWDCPVRPGQLLEYDAVLSRPEVPGNKRLVTIVAQPKQKKDAQAARLSVPAVHLLWEDIYEMLVGLPTQEPLFTQFLDFMKDQNLNPGRPLEAHTMRAFLASASFTSQLTRYADKLLAEHDWSGVPGAYRSNPKVKDRWGRIALEFTTPGWKPTLTVGFLYDAADHGVAFTAPGESVDVFLRLEADPATNANADEALGALRQRAGALRGLGARVLLRDDAGNTNRYSLLIAQQSLAAVIQGLWEERAQVQAVYDKLAGWTACLFQDQSLEGVLAKLKPLSRLNGQSDTP